MRIRPLSSDERAAPHLVAAFNHTAGGVLGQVALAAKSCTKTDLSVQAHVRIDEASVFARSWTIPLEPAGGPPQIVDHAVPLDSDVGGPASIHTRAADATRSLVTDDEEV